MFNISSANQNGNAPSKLVPQPACNKAKQYAADGCRTRFTRRCLRRYENKMKATLLLFSYFLISCSDGVEHRYFEDPISGEKTPARVARIDDWAITSIDNGILILSKNGEGVVAISSEKDKREITIFSPSNALSGAAKLTDEGSDLIYESISYGNDKLIATDIALDGELDAILDFDKRELLVNYKGSFYPFIDRRDDRHIIVNNKKIPMVYRYGAFVAKE